jgi:hypothetical protein
MFDIVREMRERDGAVGGFAVFDETDTRVGFMDFTRSGEHDVVAESAWGRLEVHHTEGETGEKTVSLDGKSLASLVFAKMYMKMNLRMASGQEIPFKMTLFTNVLHHESDLGDFRYKVRMPGAKGGAARCSVSVKASYSVRAEDVVLVLLAFYGYQCQSARDVMEAMDKTP